MWAAKMRIYLMKFWHCHIEVSNTVVCKGVSCCYPTFVRGFSLTYKTVPFLLSSLVVPFETPIFIERQMETVGEITLLRQLSQKINAVAKTAWFVAIWKFLWIWKHCKEKREQIRLMAFFAQVISNNPWLFFDSP